MFIVKILIQIPVSGQLFFSLLGFEISEGRLWLLNILLVFLEVLFLKHPRVWKREIQAVSITRYLSIRACLVGTFCQKLVIRELLFLNIYSHFDTFCGLNLPPVME